MMRCILSNNSRTFSTQLAQKINVVLVGILLLLSISVTAQTKYYVDADNASPGDGSTWEKAFTSLQDALDVVTTADTIWVAEGTYIPSLANGGSGDRFRTFFLDKDMVLYGGFAGSETTLAERNWVANPTILNGDLDMDGDNSDNAYHVLRTNGLTNAAIIDGFKIVKGNADGISEVHKFGGGISNFSSSPTVTNCTFDNNSGGNGGGMYNGNNSNPILTNCIFYNNFAVFGGGVYNISNSSPILTNCTFNNNSTIGSGGGIYNNTDSEPTLINCIIWGNQANSSQTSSSASIHNFNNGISPNISYCLIANSGGNDNWNVNIGTNGGNNIDTDPLFIDATNGDLRLQVCSPALNAGDDSANSETTDLANNPRKYGTIDMGANETPVNLSSGDTLYVNAASTAPKPDGTSWTNAYTSLGDALFVAHSSCMTVEEIWVAKGTYHPSYEEGGVGDRFKTFYINKDLKIYGGFEGGEGSLTDRDWMNNPTILSGDLDMDGDNSDNAYHVIRTEGLTHAAIINGFTVTAGNADYSSFPNNSGGGMYNSSSSSPTVTNCTFEENAANSSGGGMSNFSTSNPTVTNCTFEGNTASYGGGIYNDFSSPTVNNCTFEGNTAGVGGGMSNFSTSNPTVTNCKFNGNTASSLGGGMSNRSFSDPTVTNCTFTTNSASRGGGMRNYDNSSPRVTNCTFAGNIATNYGGGMYNFESSPTVSNCIIWDNQANSSQTSSSASIHNSSSSPIINYSLIANWGVSGTNLNTNPLFVDAANGDLRLQVCSPALNAGDDSANSETTDLANNPRKYGTIDMGAYESQVGYLASETTRLYVDATSAAVYQDGHNWDSAYTSLGDALYVAQLACSNVTEIWISAGTYYPTYNHGGEDDRFNTFYIQKNIQIYGGFEGIENDLAQRDWSANPTILSGDLGIVGDITDNAYHVIRTEGLTNSAIIDGFTVTAGNAEGSYFPDHSGGGMYNYTSNPRVTNCVFEHNKAENEGGAIFNENATPDIKNCSFENNISGVAAGAIYNRGTSNTLITNCIFNNNQSVHGGAVYNYNNAHPVIINTLFKNNTASLEGGAMTNLDADLTLINTTFYNNSATIDGGGIYNASSSPSLTNCIIWGNQVSGSSTSTSASIYNDNSNPTISYSLIANWGSSGTIIDTDALFVDAANGDLRLQVCSPALNAGDDSANSETTDLANNPRKYGTIDMGAYESQVGYLASETTRLYVDATSAAVYQDGHNWDSAYTSLGDALYVAQLACSNVTEIWISAGTYYPTYNHGGEDDRFNTFYIQKNIQIYGGFEGIENDLAQRDWSANPTILSGDLGIVGDITDNAYHVLWTDGLTDASVIDGFRITDGNANGSGVPHNRAGGMYNVSSSPTIINCTFELNRTNFEGGAIYNNSSNPSITNCTFELNTATFGGAQYNKLSSPSITNCIFDNNTALNSGGAMYNFNLSSLNLINCAFNNNTALNSGGALYNNSSSPLITNCILWNNYSNGINTSTDASISNIVSSTPAISYSLIANSGGSSAWQTTLGTNGGNNIDTDPLFVDAANGDLRLQACSRAINTGDDTANNQTTDLAGNPRKYGAIDMGAYEYQMDIFTRRYVDSTSVTSTPDGKTWATAYPSLADVIAEADTCNVTEIWVAKGTYYPTYEQGGVGERYKTFYIEKDVKIYGGFNGSETTLEERDWVANPTILSGDLGIQGGISDNAYNVIRTEGLTDASIIDGFTITEGNANGSGNHGYGGGMYNNLSSPTLTNCNFINNTATYHGGGMYNTSSSPTLTNCTFNNNSANYGGGIYNSSSSPSLTNCNFINNSTTYHGGGMANSSSSPSLTNCTFNNNSANYGGGIYNSSSSPSLTNCTIEENTAHGYGGGMRNYSSSHPSLTNCTFNNNSANQYGGGMANSSSNPSLTNCIIWSNQVSGSSISTSASIYNDNSNTTIRYSLIANSGGSSNWNNDIGNNQGYNIDTDPIFVDAFNGDLRLQACSPAINKGNNNYNYTPTDLAGNPRKHGIIDMGAYETQVGYLSGSTSRLYVNAASTASLPDGTTWANAYSNLGDALFAAQEACGNVAEIWVAQGTYKPTYEHGGNGIHYQTFFIGKDIQLHGGFAGTENMLSQRDWVANPTILSGDLGIQGDISDNAYHVLTTENLSEETIIEGFTITGGNADDGTISEFNSKDFYAENFVEAIGEIYFSNNLSNNDGGGMLNFQSNPTINNCIIYGNIANNNGGAMLNFFANPTINNCVFYDNTVSQDGGAVFNLYGNPTSTNSTFYNNTASNTGGALFNLYSNPEFKNTLIWSNTAAGSTSTTSASIANEYNSKPTFSYSLVANSGGSADWQGIMGGDGGNNIDTDPQFVDAPNGNLRLQTCSFAMDAGTNSDVPAEDLDGNPRPYNTSSVDIGAYEVQEERPSPEAICQNITVQLDADGTATITPAQIDNGSSVTCGDIPVLMLSQTEFTCADIGVNEITLTVQDIFNNIDICTATVTVEETELSVSGGALSVPITNGDNTPDIADGTHFGSTTSQVYTIVNNGQTTSLDLSSVVLSDNTNFSVVFITNPIGPGASGHCAIDFIGTGGPHTSMVTINSSNCNYAPFEFMIEATEPIIVCPESHNLSGDIPTDIYEASGTITSDGTVAATSDVTFKANEIILTAGFTVAAGGTFTAQIDPCSESFVEDEIPTTTLKIEEEEALQFPTGETTTTIASSTEKAPVKQAKIKTNNSDLVIYPNPTNSHLTLACDCEIIAYKIIDTSGKVVKEGRQNHKTIDQLDVLAEGFYFLQVLSTEGNYFKQFVKQ